jgi:two-component system NtrC family sensor kinase
MLNGTQSLSRGANPMRGERRPFSDTSSLLLGLAGLDGELKYLNPAWEKVLGYSPQQLLDRPLCELMQHERSAALVLVDRLLAEDSFESMEFGLRCKDGTCKWFSWHRRFNPEHKAVFIVGHDITEQKSREIVSILRSYGQSIRTHTAA